LHYKKQFPVNKKRFSYVKKPAFLCQNLVFLLKIKKHCAILKAFDKQGSLLKQAERKFIYFDPLPDADNAAVGSHIHVFFRAVFPMLPFLCQHKFSLFIIKI